nr:hypothetical protein [Tanacetum cinerariifolium]
MNIQPTSVPSTSIYVHAEENNDNQAKEEYLPDDEFANPFCALAQDVAESSSHNIGNSNVPTFNQPQVSEYQWTKDHPLEQVHGNPSKPVQTRLQLATDPEICMFAFTVSTAEPKNINEAMANSAWIEALDGEPLDKMKEKRDLWILVGYSTQSKGCRVYNKRTRLIVESIHIRFDEIKEMYETSVANNTSGLVPQRQKASDYDNSDLVTQLHNVSSSTDVHVPSQQELDLLFGPLYDEFFNAGTSSVNKSSSPTDNSKHRDTQPTTNIQ